MSRDNDAPGEEARLPQARRLAEQALAARRAGDEATADRLFAEAERVDPQSVADVLQADLSAAATAYRSTASHGSAPAPDGPSPADPSAGRNAGPGAHVRGGSHAMAGHVTPNLPVHPTEVTITLEVNGHPNHLTIDTRATLLEVLRDTLGLTGAKYGCALGQCGACTVLLDGRRINACLTLAVLADRRPITTIEGVAEDGALHPMQAAFVAHDAFQCGYCTPGQIMSAIGLLTERGACDEATIREQMSGNLCRCGAYANIVAAVRTVCAGQEG
jgi:xanthine dehydrogenase YagT iron-sulfur-binding subunit